MKEPQDNTYYFSLSPDRSSTVRRLIMELISIFAFPFVMMSDTLFKRNLGERCFSVYKSLWHVLILTIPLIIAMKSDYVRGTPLELFNASWGILILVYLVFIFRRQSERNFNPYEYDPNVYSRYPGDYLSFWRNRKRFLFWKVTPPNIDIYFQPAFFLLTGIVLILFTFTRGVGAYFVLTGFMCHISNRYSYMEARYSILDKMDEIICGLDLLGVLEGRQRPSETKSLKGFSDGAFPEDEQSRQRLKESLLERKKNRYTAE